MMKKWMTTVAALCAAGSLFAATETVDGIEWAYSINGDMAEILV